MAQCINDILASIQEDCNKPNVGGYGSRAILLQVDKGVNIVQDANNPRIITSIGYAKTTDKPALIFNANEQPFTGSNMQSNADSGRIGFTKTFSFAAPMRGAGASKDVVEPIAKNRTGFIVIVEKKNRQGDGSFEVIGAQNALTANADGVARDEYANGGDYTLTLSTTESYAEMAFFDTDYQTTLTAFNELYNAAIA